MYQNIIIVSAGASLALACYLYINKLDNKILQLEKEVVKVELQLSKRKLEHSLCKGVVGKQNREIEQLEANGKLALMRLKKWKKLPAKVRYKTIYKIREVKSNECKDIKSVLDGVSDISYDLL